MKHLKGKIIIILLMFIVGTYYIPYIYIRESYYPFKASDSMRHCNLKYECYKAHKPKTKPILKKQKTFCGSLFNISDNQCDHIFVCK